MKSFHRRVKAGADSLENSRSRCSYGRGRAVAYAGISGGKQVEIYSDLVSCKWRSFDAVAQFVFMRRTRIIFLWVARYLSCRGLSDVLEFHYAEDFLPLLYLLFPMSRPKPKWGVFITETRCKSTRKTRNKLLWRVATIAPAWQRAPG
jgi:hypothetical protein